MVSAYRYRCIHSCIYAYMHICTYISAESRFGLCAPHLWWYLPIGTHTFTCTYTHMWTYISSILFLKRRATSFVLSASKYIGTCVYVYLCIHVHIYATPLVVFTSKYISTCVYVYIFIHIHIYVYIGIYTYMQIRANVRCLVAKEPTTWRYFAKKSVSKIYCSRIQGSCVRK